MDVVLTDKVVVITGASRGIGCRLAKDFAKEGAVVLVNYCNSELNALETYSIVKKYSPNSVLYKADVRNLMEVSAMHDFVMTTFGHVDVVINNAGINDDGLIRTMTVQQWQNVIDVNLTGTFNCCKVFISAMERQGWGKIVNIASLIGQEGGYLQGNYAASKAGIIALTKSLAKETGDFGVSVNAVCPGFVVTDLNKRDERKRDTAIKRSALPIHQTMDTLSSFVRYIASDAFSGVSGRIFNLDSRVF